MGERRGREKKHGVRARVSARKWRRAPEGDDDGENVTELRTCVCVCVWRRERERESS